MATKMATTALERPARWNLPMQLLHWSSAVILAAVVAYGWWMTEFPARSQRLFHYGLHGSVGVLLVALMCARLGWRLVSREPRVPPGTGGWERAAARWTHRALYVLVFAAGLSGIALSYTFRQPLDVTLLGLWSLPSFAFGDPGFWHEFLEELHEVVVAAMLWVCGAHVAAVACHHWVWRDSTMRRMLPH